MLAILETRGSIETPAVRRALLDQFELEHKRREPPGRAPAASDDASRSPALVTRPRLMLLDEPFAAVDPHTVEELQAEVRRLADEGIAMPSPTTTSSRPFGSATGRTSSTRSEPPEGDPKSIINDPEVRNAYLASTFRGDEFD